MSEYTPPLMTPDELQDSLAGISTMYPDQIYTAIMEGQAEKDGELITDMLEALEAIYAQEANIDIEHIKRELFQMAPEIYHKVKTAIAKAKGEA